MPKHLYVERRSHRRTEEAPVECDAAEQKRLDERQQARNEDVAELEATSEDLLNRIDDVLAQGLGYVGISAA